VKQQSRPPGCRTFSTVPRICAPGATTARPFVTTGAMTTASTGSASLELREETPVKSRMQMSVPAGASCAIARAGISSRQIRISKCYPFRCGRDESVGIPDGPVGINNRGPKLLIP
jgi:hypothetical protein